MSDKIPVILDTDIGSDIDDALALSYLLGQPRCELLGVTTVSGNTVQRAALADWLCQSAGRPHIPIIAGLDKPLLDGPGQPNVPQFNAYPGKVTRKFDHDAVKFLRDQIRARPHKVTLLAIGPLTNVAALFVADPEIPALVDQIVLMSGIFGQTEEGKRYKAEWNVRCDPLASAIVYRHARPGSLTSIGLDVTMQCREAAETCRKMFSSGHPTMQATLKMAEVWFRDAKEIIFHDPLAASLIFRPELCHLETGRVDVTYSPGATEGESPFTPSVPGQHRVCSSVDRKLFFEDYYQVTGCHAGA